MQKSTKGAIGWTMGAGLILGLALFLHQRENPETISPPASWGNTTKDPLGRGRSLKCQIQHSNFVEFSTKNRVLDVKSTPDKMIDGAFLVEFFVDKDNEFHLPYESLRIDGKDIFHILEEDKGDLGFRTSLLAERRHFTGVPITINMQRLDDGTIVFDESRSINKRSGYLATYTVGTCNPPL